jgi:hypothetical protein
MARSTGPSLRESEAAGAVSKMLQGFVTVRDVPEAPNGTHDFDIARNNGNIVALEVTSLTVQNVMAMEAAIKKRKWRDERLAFDWSPMITMAARKSMGADIAKFHQSVAHICKSLEDRGGTHHGALTGEDLIANGTFRDKSPVDPDLLKLYELGVRHLNVFVPYDGGGQISIGFVGMPENESINDLLIPVTESNVEKLRRATASERHLFVWVDRTDWETESKMILYQLPTSPLSMVESLDALWLGLYSPKFKTWTNVAALWRADREGNWSDETALFWRT